MLSKFMSVIQRGGGQALCKRGCESLKRRKDGKNSKNLRPIRPLSGVVMLEVALTLPAICALIFFAIELMNIHITQAALDAICAEATLYFIATGGEIKVNKMAGIDSIIEKHRPAFIPKTGSDGYPIIRYWFRLYTDLAKMCATSPYGGEDIGYPPYSTDANARGHAGSGGTGAEAYFGLDNGAYLMSTGHIPDHASLIKYLNGTASSSCSGVAFVLTFVCAYPFSNAFIKKLFHGGVNSKKGTSGKEG
jgi:hypothetical protein